MTLIECKSGPTSQLVGGQTYDFTKDDHGRFVCDVTNLRHIECLLSVEAHYCKAKDLTTVPTNPAPMPKPATKKAK